MKCSATSLATNKHKKKLKELVANVTGVPKRNIRDYEIDYPTVRRRLLYDIWAVYFSIIVPLADVPGSSTGPVLSDDIEVELSSTSFSASLISLIPVITSVDGVNATFIPRTDMPSMSPTVQPTPTPTMKPTKEAGGSNKAGGGLAGMASSGTVVIGGVVIVGCLLICAGIGIWARASKGKDNSEAGDDGELLDVIDTDAGSLTTSLTMFNMFKKSKSVQSKNDFDKEVDLEMSRGSISGSVGGSGSASSSNASSMEHLVDVHLEDIPFAKGAFGHVYKGTYYENPIAAKQMFGSDEVLAELKHEVATLKKLCHPYIITCYGTWQDDKKFVYMIMEYAGGGTLTQYYITQKFNNAEFVRIVSEMLAAVSYLHSLQIAHRDLKPDNVLLESNTLKVKLADFGLAKPNQIEATRGTGTPYYMVSAHIIHSFIHSFCFFF
jgi:hypothetical protein